MITLSIVVTLALGQVGRTDVTGRAALQGGADWGGARIVLVSHAFARNERAGRTDRIEVAADASGRFRAKVLPGRTYSVWAVQAGEGEYDVSDVVEPVVAGVPVVVTRSATRRRQVLEVTGLDKWRRRRLVAHVRTKTRHAAVHPITLDENGRCQLPPLPGASAIFEVWHEGGGRLLRRDVPLLGARAVQLAMPQPHRVLVAVHDAKTKRYIKGARVFERVRGNYCEVGRTNSKGMCLMMLPLQPLDGLSDKRDYYFFVRKDGYAEGYAEYRRGSLATERDKTPAPDVEPDLSVKLIKGTRITGRLVGFDGKPCADTSLLLYQAGPFGSDEQDPTKNPCPTLWRTGHDGSFAIESVPVGVPYRLCALPDPKSLPTRPFDWVCVAIEKGSRTELGDLRLDKLATLTVHVRTSDGADADRARVKIATSGLDPLALGTPFEIVTDRRGVARLRLPPVANISAVVLWEGGIREELVGWRNGNTGMHARLTVPMRFAHALRGSVLTPEGKPAADVRVSARIPTTMSGGHVLRCMMFAQLMKSKVFHNHQTKGVQGKTDANGKFELRVPFVKIPYEVSVDPAAGRRNPGRRMTAEQPAEIHLHK